MSRNKRGAISPAAIRRTLRSPIGASGRASVTRTLLPVLLAIAVIVGADVALAEVGSAPAQQSADATLSALVLTDTNSNTVALDQTFDAATTSYTSTVEHDVDEITVTPTKGDSGASIEYLDGSDSTFTDADDVTTGQQVSLAVGDTTFKVKVTAEDGNTTQTYTLTVTRLT